MWFKETMFSVFGYKFERRNYQKLHFFQVGGIFYYFCDSRNIKISRFQLFSVKFLILKNSDILFGSDYKREN